ncbi:DNA polymerase, partial [bacterium]|nr:DNA polymerase [bacterium]
MNDVIVYSFLDLYEHLKRQFFDRKLFEGIIDKIVDLKHLNTLNCISKGIDLKNSHVEEPMHNTCGDIVGLRLIGQDISCEVSIVQETYSLKQLYKSLLKDIELPKERSHSHFGLLTQNLQVKAEIALFEITAKGINLDNDLICNNYAQIRIKIDKAWTNLERYHVSRTSKYIALINHYLNQDSISERKEIKASLDRIDNAICNPTLTKCTKDILIQLRVIFEFSPYELLLRSMFNKYRSYPQYRTLTSTGRSTSYKSDLGVHIQGVSKKSLSILKGFRDVNLRRVFTPDKNKVFLQVDYSIIELCSLAQICLDKFGKSVLANRINEGHDIHTFVASKILSKEIEEVTGEERTMMKVVNYGLSGGMGIPKLFKALSEVDKTMTTDKTKQIRAAWFDLFPQVREHLNPSCSVYGYYNLNTLPNNGEYETIIEKKFLNVCSGIGTNESRFREESFMILQSHMADFSI